MLRIVAIVLVTVSLAFAAWANSATTLYSKFAPERGLQMDSASAQALINVTERELAKKDKSTFQKIVRSNTVTALRSEPLASRALRQLGVYYAMTGKNADARKLIRLAGRLSRRDTQGQLWLAEDYLRDGQHEQGLRAIDVVIRTEPSSRETFFRVLGATLADPEFNRVFVTYARRKPSWLGAFIEYNVATSEQPQLLSRTLVQLQPLPATILSDTSSSVLLTALVNRAPINDARAFYLKLPNANPGALESLAFQRPADNLRFPPVGWELLNHNNVQGFGDVNGNSIVIEGTAAPARSGTVARKLLFLRAGSYRWTGNADLDHLSGGTASVGVMCNGGPGDWTFLARKELTRSNNSFDFTVSADCLAQLIAINIVGADGQSDVSMEVGEMRLVPLRSATSAASGSKFAPPSL